MIAQAMEFIKGLADSARKIELTKDPELPRKIFVRTETGHEIIDVPPPPRSAKIEDVTDLVELLSDPTLAKKPEVYVDSDAVLAWTDGDERDGVIRLPLHISSRFSFLCQLSERAYTAKELTKLLRLQLYGDHSGPLIAALASVDFSRTSGGKQTLGHGKESLGRAVEAQVQTIDKVPQAFEIAVPVFRNRRLDYAPKVVVNIYIDVDAERFELHPREDDVMNAMDAAVRNVISVLEEDLAQVAPVFSGTPKHTND